MQNSTYRQNYAVDMTLSQLYQTHWIISEVNDVIKQFCMIMKVLIFMRVYYTKQIDSKLQILILCCTIVQ